MQSAYRHAPDSGKHGMALSKGNREIMNMKCWDEPLGHMGQSCGPLVTRILSHTGQRLDLVKNRMESVSR